MSLKKLKLKIHKKSANKVEKDITDRLILNYNVYS